jgi:putative tricarboxylic transport membrane protein
MTKASRRRTDFIGSLLLFLLALFAFLETGKFKIGTLGEPKEGMFPLILSLALGGLSVLSLIIAFIGGPEASPTEEEDGVIIWKKLISYIVALLAYAFLFDYLGYFMSSLIVLFFVLRFAEGVELVISLAVTFCTLIISYLVFDLLLLVPLPKGILGWP